MDQVQFLQAIQIDGKVITKRCTESYLQKIGLLDWLINNTPADFLSISEKIKYQLYGGGYCEVCQTRTNVDVSGRGFAKYCKGHFHFAKKGKIASNHKYIDISRAVDLYTNHHKSIIEIAEIIGNISNVTLKKKLVEAGVELRSHSTTQKMKSTKRGKHTHLYDKNWWETQYQTKSSETLARELECSPGLVLRRLKYYNISATNHVKPTLPEFIIEQCLQDCNVTYIKNDRTVLSGRELDFYIPSKNLALEVNGIFWHSTARGKDSRYHLSKTQQCEQQNIQLVHFWDAEITNHQHLVTSMIRSKLGTSERIYARKCDVSIITSQQAKSFFVTNHLQGYAVASIHIGLFHNNTLVCVGSFSSPRFNRHFDYELIRFASKINTTVVGGLSKILNRIEGTCLSYADRRWGVGRAYTSCGFKLINTLSPDYYYTKDFRNLLNRMKFQKHKLTHLDCYDVHKTEQHIMSDAGYHQVWDCGNLVFAR